MNCEQAKIIRTAARAFTLVEVMMALVLIGIVVPVVAQGLRVASRAGEVAERKALAVRIAERVLTDSILNGTYSGAQSGTENAGSVRFEWRVKDEPWSALSTIGLSSLNAPDSVNTANISQNNIHQISATVSFTAQGQAYSVQTSTLFNITAP